MATPNPDHGLILRRWRDGSVHAEVPLTSFHDDEGVINTHLDGREGNARFVTACGVSWWGRGSASGFGPPQRIGCEICRKILMGED